ncbi:MAG: MotA/TolQ/ExbB proton channel family protein [Fusobacteriaceae bacterium]
MYNYFLNGGFLMWVLLFMSISAMSIIVEKIIYLFKNEKKYHKIFKERILFLVKDNDIKGAVELASTENNAIGRTLQEFLVRINREGDFHHFQQLAKEIEFKEMAGIERHLHILGIIATSAPMVGLLGTVTGMITAFNTMATHGAGNPNLVAGGISTALITTASGLIVSIPALVIYNLLTAKTEEISEEIDKITTSIINVVRN